MPDNVFLYSDLSGIEARTLRWLADCPSLQMFIDFDNGGPDPYKATAARAFGLHISKVTDVHRQVGKVLVLQCQYQSGWKKVKSTVPTVTDQFAKNAVEAFRKSHTQIVKLWANFNRAFKLVLTGEREKVSTNHLTFYSAGRAIVGMKLPGGRSIYYNKCRILTKDIQISEEKILRKGSIAYYKHDSNPSVERELTGYYGGLGSENGASGMARDIFAAAMLQCEKSELPIVHHTHDSVMSEVRRACAKLKAAQLEKIMTNVPQWAAGLPIKSPVKIVNRMP